MICPNCGAEYEDGSLRCPYCGSENKTAAAEEKKKTLDQFDRQALRMETEVPKKAMKKWTRILLWCMGIILILGVIGSVMSVVSGKLAAKMEYINRQKYLAKLEELYLSGDYGEMGKYMDKHNLYAAVYLKYDEVYDVYLYQERMRESVAELQDIAASEDLYTESKAELMPVWYEWMLEDAAKVFDFVQEKTEDTVLLGNEPVLRSFYDATEKELAEKGFSEEEIALLQSGGGAWVSLKKESRMLKAFPISDRTREEKE